MTRPYRPSNGTEGMIFMERFCDRCERDRLWRLEERDPCPILSDTMLYDPGDPAYPKEWIEEEGKDGFAHPRCTAFEEELTEEKRAERALAEAHRRAEEDGQARLPLHAVPGPPSSRVIVAACSTWARLIRENRYAESFAVGCADPECPMHGRRP